jgi:hypothetical protein
VKPEKAFTNPKCGFTNRGNNWSVLFPNLAARLRKSNFLKADTHIQTSICRMPGRCKDKKSEVVDRPLQRVPFQGFAYRRVNSIYEQKSTPYGRIINHATDKSPVQASAI